ncbi:MAG: hypothetical protein HY860_05400 [Chlamydiales bacterium]|nr:hypothetical protein [Chlamydiales bacterium]
MRHRLHVPKNTFATSVCFFMLMSSMLQGHFIDRSIEENFVETPSIEKLGILQEHMVVQPTFQTAGMFAVCNLVLGHLALYDQGHYRELTINFAEGGVYYDTAHGSNWWNYYFEPLHLQQEKLLNSHLSLYPHYFAEHDILDTSSDPSLEPSYVGSYTELNRVAISLRRALSREDAGNLVKKYIHVKPFILKAVDQFILDHLNADVVIGVHYRGTDKSSEAPRTTYHEVFKAIENNIKNLDKINYKIFVATDEEGFIKHLKARFKDKVVFTTASRSSGNISIHHRGENPYQTGLEAIIDAILLSKCDLLIRTSSNLSLWSSYFNTQMPVILLNARYGNIAE